MARTHHHFPVRITVYVDRSFTFITTTPPASIPAEEGWPGAKVRVRPNKIEAGTVTETGAPRSPNPEDAGLLNAAVGGCGGQSIKGTHGELGIKVTA